MKLRRITEITPIESRCIEVNSDNRLFAAGGEKGNSFITHNSVVQRNIILSTILRPDNWRFLGIDLKKVELSGFRKYSNVVLGIATTLDDALTVLRFAQETMMKRYAELEQLGLNNFLDLPEKGQALMVMVDELGELLTPSGVKALSEHTIIPKADGTLTTMKKLNIGDIILDNYSQPCTVTKKYTPQKQDKYDMMITSDTTKKTEKIVSGSEHNWAVFIEDDKGNIENDQYIIMETKELYEFKKQENMKPEAERRKIKFRRFK